jgi:DNA (cytosine-5)-methyltransferase 1
VAFSSFYDLRHFAPPRGVFDGVIGGDPCQAHSSLSNIVRAQGLEPSFPDLTPEFQRVIEAARPRWFLRENVPGAPEIKPAGYAVKSFLLDHSTMDAGEGTGHEQMRRRRFWFGMCGDSVPELRAHIRFAFSLLPNSMRRAVTFGGEQDSASKRAERKQAVIGRHHERVGDDHGRKGSDVRYTLEEMLDLQGLPRDIFKHSPLTMQGKRKLIGNAVPLPMAEALGRAVASSLAAL